MSTPELIVRSLSAAHNQASQDHDDPTIHKYAAMVIDKYRQYRRTTDFRSAMQRSEVETVEQIILDREIEKRITP